jgi:molybdate transport system substrate-binding protein
MRRWIAVVGAVAAFAAVAGSRPATGADGRALTVFAAADLAFAFRDLVPRFEQATGATVTLVLGSTGNLAKQIEHGAPADVFFAADESFVDDLVAKGAVIAETRARYAQGRLALVTAPAAPVTPTDVADLRDARIRRIAIANPAHAPYGRAAEQALRARGVWEAVKPKLIYGENVRQALQFVESGAADAGVVALAVAVGAGLAWTAIDPALHAPLNQAVAVVRRSPRPAAALAFVRFVTGPEGRPIMRRHGFLLPGDF